MKILVHRKPLQPVTASKSNGLVSIWWYTDDREFWDFSTVQDAAVDCYGYLQYSDTKNHMNLWRTAVAKYVPAEDQESVLAKGYKSIERGRVVFNVRTQAFEIICSDALVNDVEFREQCIKHFNLQGCRYSFEALHHYGKQELTGNPAVDSMYYE